MCIYHTGTRADLITELSEMKKHLEQDETELLELVQSVVDKLSVMSDGEFGIIIEELVANFE
jgi:hypothetical protein